jgi:molybdenum cofactor biosynthesis protein B
MSKSPGEFVPLAVAVLTVSDSRSRADDSSGDYLQLQLAEAGHRVVARELLRADKHRLRAQICHWLIDDAIQVIIVNGGTGYTARDVVPEAVAPLFDQAWSGFGELFRQLSFGDIGSSALQSRALAGFANGALIVCVPGSPNACRLAWQQLLAPQLDARTRPCSVVPQLRGTAALCGRS